MPQNFQLDYDDEIISIRELFAKKSWDEGFALLEEWRQKSSHINPFGRKYFSILHFLLTLPAELIPGYCAREEQVSLAIMEATIRRWLLSSTPEQEKATIELTRYGLSTLKSPEMADFYVRKAKKGAISQRHINLSLAYKSITTDIRVYLRVLALTHDMNDIQEQMLMASYREDIAAAYVMAYVYKRDIHRCTTAINASFTRLDPNLFKGIVVEHSLPLRIQSELDSNELHGDALLAANLGISKNRLTSKDFILETWYCRKALLDFQDRTDLTWKKAGCKEHAEQCELQTSVGAIKPFSDESWDERIESIRSNSKPFSETLTEASFEFEGLRKWQKDALKSWAAHGRHGIIEAATGSGKSRVGAAAAFEALEDGFAVLIVCPTRVLQQQWIADYFNHIWSFKYNKVFTIGNSEGTKSRERMSLIPGTITVAVAATLSQLDDIRVASDTKVLAIFDEVHNYTGDERRKMLRPVYERRLGLTATLMPPKGRYGLLTNYFGGEPVFRYTFTNAVKDRVISDYHLMFIRIPMDENDFRRYRAAYKEMSVCKDILIGKMQISDNIERFERELSRLKNKGAENSLITQYEESLKEVDRLLGETHSKANALRIIASFVKQRGHTIVFSDFVKTANNVKTIFQNGGISTVVIDANVPQGEREYAIGRLTRGELKSVISPKALDEGVDIPALNMGIFAGTERNRLKIVQRLGRVLRIYTGKPVPIIVLPVYMGTDEDPLAPDNDGLTRSNYKDLYDNAIRPISVLEVSSEESILKTLEAFAANSISEAN